VRSPATPTSPSSGMSAGNGATLRVDAARSREIEVAAHEPQNFRRGIADVASPNAIVLHDNSLSELFSDGLRDEARDCVCPAAGSIGNDQAYWPRPIALCPRDA
jgi:hypothetical protein